MTFAEIKEMINSTITENGERHITGRALNLALTETVNQAESVQQAQEDFLEDFQNNTVPAFEEMILARIEEALANVSGSGVQTIKMGTKDTATNVLVQTEAEMAWNAEVYNKCETALETGQPLPPIQIDGSGMMSTELPEGTDLSGAATTFMAYQTTFIVPGSDVSSAIGVSGLIFMDGNTPFVVSENGAVTLMQ